MSSSPDKRRLLTLLPLALAALVLLGTSRLSIESACSVTICHHILQRLFTSTSKLKVISRDEQYSALRDGCNVFEGEWVLDDADPQPLYTEKSCPYLTRQMTCQKNGRPDSLYERWRWKPYACQLPRFDAIKLLESLRNKRLMFVGDSLQRNQWESMVCLLQSAIPDADKYIHQISRRRKIFVAEKFNASIEFYRGPFINELKVNRTKKYRMTKGLVKINSIAKHGKHWKGVDVLVFESYAWWMNKPRFNPISEPVETKEYVLIAYRLALAAWARWLESHLNPQKQRAFFMGLSPTHIRSWEWQPGSDGNCFNEADPIQKPYKGAGSGLEIIAAVKDTLRELRVNVTYLDITQLSEYRKDGHTSVYTELTGRLLAEAQKSQPELYADCVHWCLPGVPDTWNEILYAYMLHGPVSY